MASGLAMCRINRPNIWLHRPAKFTKNTLAKTEPSTYGPRRKSLASQSLSAGGGRADAIESGPLPPGTFENDLLQPLAKIAI